MSASLGASGACYTTRPLMGSPDAGVVAVATLNDRGRTALNDAVGGNADQIEGTVMSRTDSAFVLSVRNVRYFGGTTNDWSGEQVTVPVAGVRGLQERRFARGRTYLLAGGIAAAIIAFIATRSLLTDDSPFVEEPGPGGPPQGSFLPTRP